ncbi:MAG: GntR family transcriptional regulator [Pseudomonadota bacterium]
MAPLTAQAKPRTEPTNRSADRSLEIVEGLRQAILEHRLKPGAKLSEDEVGEVYGVSRTVVRAALQSLAHSELVSIEKNRGAFVARPSVQEAREVFEARALIEPKVANMAAGRMSPRHLNRLIKHIEIEHAANAKGDKGHALALSGEFHLEIARIAGHRLYTQFVETLISRSSLIIALYWKRPDTTCESHSHEALLSAFERGDGQNAENIMRSHIVDLSSGLDLNPDAPPNKSLAEALLVKRR